MALETATTLWIGTDATFVFSVLNVAQTAAINITGWSLSWMLKRRAGVADIDALLTKTVSGGGIVISGTYNSDPNINTQVATVTIADTDTDALSARINRYELKRMDAGVETILAYGDIELLRSVHHA